MDTNIKSLFITMNILGSLVVVLIILGILDKSMRWMPVKFTQLPEFIIWSIILLAFFFSTAWGILKQKKFAYYLSWVALVVVILRFKLIGIIVAIFMGTWLSRSKKLFLKN